MSSNIVESLRQSQTAALDLPEAPVANAVEPCPRATDHWIEINLVDDEGKPVAGEPYALWTPGASQPLRGTLDGNGHLRLEHLPPGMCKVVFPDREPLWWQPVPGGKPLDLEPEVITPATLVGETPHWLEIELTDDQGAPMAGEPYKVVLADGSVVLGELNDAGFDRLENICPGSAKVSFPDREPSWFVAAREPEAPPVNQEETTIASATTPYVEQEVTQDA